MKCNRLDCVNNNNGQCRALKELKEFNTNKCNFHKTEEERQAQYKILRAKREQDKTLAIKLDLLEGGADEWEQEDF